LIYPLRVQLPQACLDRSPQACCASPALEPLANYTITKAGRAQQACGIICNLIVDKINL